jgi:hypothetical protein
MTAEAVRRRAIGSDVQAITHGWARPVTAASSSRLWRIRRVAEALLVGAACFWLSPLDTRTVFAAASEYVRTTAFGGSYDRIVYSHVHQRPFEACPGVEAVHAQSLQRIAGSVPRIEARSRFEPNRIGRLIRVFNRESQAFYSSDCSQPWTYSYNYAGYQSYLTRMGPSIWLIDAFHGSEIYAVVLLVLGSWLGIGCLFWITRSLSNSSIVGFASLAALWFGVSMLGLSLGYVDFRLNLFNTLAMVGIAQFLCDLPPSVGRWRAWALEAFTACLFALYGLLLLFCRLPPTRLDAFVLIACVFAVAAVRRDWDVLRRAVLLLAFFTVFQSPYQRFSAGLLGPVSSVNTAASDEFKLVNVVQYLNERPSHFGNFTLDFNQIWIHDGDYYLRRLSPVSAFHHGYPPWGRRFLTETLLRHPTEIPNAWWKRFAVQMMFHKELSHGIYGAHATFGTVVVWSAVGFGFIVLLGGRHSSSAWPLIGIVFWEMFGLQTFLALMHTHNLHLIKGLVLLWCALPTLAIVGARKAATWLRPPFFPHWKAWRLPRGLAMAAVAAGAVLLVLAGAWIVRELRKETHVTHIWLAVHDGLTEREAFLSPDALVREIEAVRDLGGEAPGTVSMYGAWALFGYLERVRAYTALTGRPISEDHVKRLMFQYYKRALAEGPDNPHFYSYARYFNDPDWPVVFATALQRFPAHPYRAMMSWDLATEATSLTGNDRTRYQALYQTSVRDQLHDSESFRPGYVALPSVTATGPVVATADAMLTTALPGEVVALESFPTFSTDRLSIGLFLRVTEGQLSGRLVDERGGRLADLPAMSPADPISYRAWHFDDIAGNFPKRPDSHAQLVLVAGPRGARFLVRDLYPIVENPRWFR